MYIKSAAKPIELPTIPTIATISARKIMFNFSLSNLRSSAASRTIITIPIFPKIGKTESNPRSLSPRPL